MNIIEAIKIATESNYSVRNLSGFRYTQGMIPYETTVSPLTGIDPRYLLSIIGNINEQDLLSINWVAEKATIEITKEQLHQALGKSSLGFKYLNSEGNRLRTEEVWRHLNESK